MRNPARKLIILIVIVSVLLILWSLGVLKIDQTVAY